MKEKISLELKKRMSSFFKSSEFDEVFFDLHIPPILAWGFFIIAIISVIGILFAFKAFKIIMSGNMATQALRKRYNKLDENGEILMTYLLITNTPFLHEEESKARAYVVGNFNHGKDDSKILELLETWGNVAKGETSLPYQEELKEFINKLDDDKLACRFQIPAQFTEGMDLTVFRIKLFRDFLPDKTLQHKTIPCIADPENDKVMCMIPYSIYEDFIDEMDIVESAEIANNEKSTDFASKLEAFRMKNPELYPIEADTNI